MANNFVPGSARLRLMWSHVGSVTAFNVLAAVKPGAVVVNQALADALGTAIKSGLTTSGLAPVLATTTSLTKIGIRDYSTANQVEFIDAGAAVAGGSAGDPLNPSQSFVVTLRTGLAGPRYRGRVYISGFTENANDASALAST